jgi:hypothetical protein
LSSLPAKSLEASLTEPAILEVEPDESCKSGVRVCEMSLDVGNCGQNQSLPTTDCKKFEATLITAKEMPFTLGPNRLLLSPNLLINLWTDCDLWVILA